MQDKTGGGVSVQLFLGDCLEVMRGMDAGSVDAVVCDPPYEIGFMNKAFDRTGISYNVDMWREVLRVLKPGGHLLSFGGTRTYHRMACAIEDAGFEIRDQLQWLYGSGFPKSLDISKSIDKAAGAKPIDTGLTKRASIQRNGTGETWERGAFASHPEETKRVNITAPATPDAARWQGWGTALKPANEPICLARKPLSEATVAANVLRFGTGALNIDGCRIDNLGPHGTEGRKKFNGFRSGADEFLGGMNDSKSPPNPAGRWPANVLLDDEAAAALDEQSGERTTPATYRRNVIGLSSPAPMNRANGIQDTRDTAIGYGDTGGASRFFLVVHPDDADAVRFRYCAKASRSERNAGLEGMPEREYQATGWSGDSMPERRDMRPGRTRQERPQPVSANHHPTVKPVSLMRWLVRLVTPPGGIVLDPFMGSGTTGIACALEGFDFAGIEVNADYYAIAERRIAYAQAQLALPFDMPISLEADAAT